MFTVDDYYIDNHGLDEVRNANEILVIDAIKRLRSDFPDFDNCHICIEDIYAASLNQLPPQYKQNTLLIDESEVTNKKEIDKAVRKAFKKIIKNPRHAK